MGNLTFYNPRQDDMLQGSQSTTSAKSQKFFQIPTKKLTSDDNRHPLSNSPKNSAPRRQPTIPDDLAREVSQIDPEKFGTVTTILEDPENSAPRFVKAYAIKGESSRMSKSSSSKVLNFDQQNNNESGVIDRSHDKRYDSINENSSLQKVYKSAQHFQGLRLGKDLLGDGTIKRKLADDKKLNLSTHLQSIKADVSHLANPKHARSVSHAQNMSIQDLREQQRMKIVRLLEDIGHETHSTFADSAGYLPVKSPNVSVILEGRTAGNASPLLGFKLLDNNLQESRFLKSPPMQKRTILLESLQKDIRSTQSPFSKLNSDDTGDASPLERSPKNKGPEYLHVVRSKFDSSEGSVLYLLKKELPTVFSTVPSNRQEIIALGKWLVRTLKTNQEDRKITQKEKFYKADEIYNICFNELIRQVSMDCVERAELMMMIWKAYLKLSEDIIEDIKKREEKVEERGQKEIQKVHVMYNDILKNKEDEISKLKDKLFNLKVSHADLSSQVNTFDKRQADKTDEIGKLKSYITKIKKHSQALQAETYDLQYKYQKAQKELHQIEDDPLDEQHFIQQQARRKAELELDLSSSDSEDERPGFGSAKQKAIEKVDKSVCYEHPNGFAAMEVQTDLTALEERYDKLLVDKEALDEILLEQVAKARLVQAAEMMENLSQKAVSPVPSKTHLSRKSTKEEPEAVAIIEVPEEPASIRQDTAEEELIVEPEEQEHEQEQEPELVPAASAAEIQEEDEAAEEEEEQEVVAEQQEEEEEDVENLSQPEQIDEEPEESFQEEEQAVPEVPEENQEEDEAEEKPETAINLEEEEGEDPEAAEAIDTNDVKSPALTMVTNAKSERVETEEIERQVATPEKSPVRKLYKSKTKFEAKAKTKSELEESKRPISKDGIGSSVSRSKLKKASTTILKSKPALSEKIKCLSPKAVASTKKALSKKEITTTKVLDNKTPENMDQQDDIDEEVESVATLRDVMRDSGMSFTDSTGTRGQKKSTVIIKSSKNIVTTEQPSHITEEHSPNQQGSPSIRLVSQEGKLKTEETEGDYDGGSMISPFNNMNPPNSTYNYDDRMSPSIYDTVPDSPLRSEASRTKSILRASNMSPIRHSLQGSTSPSKKITFGQNEGRKSELKAMDTVHEQDVQILSTIKQRANLKKSKTLVASSPPVKMAVSEDEAKKLEKFVEQQEQKIIQLMNMYKVEKQKHDDIINVKKQLEKQVSADHQIIHDLSTFCDDLKKKLELTEQHKERLANILKGIEERNRQINIIDENKFNSSQSSLDVSKMSGGPKKIEFDRVNARKFGSLEANFNDLGSPQMHNSPYKSTTNVPVNSTTQARRNFIREKRSNPGQNVIAKLQIKPVNIKQTISPRSAGKAAKPIPVKDLLPLKSVLKQITSFYAEKVQMAKDSPITKEQDMGTFIYKQFLNTYGFQQFALKKFTKFVSSVKAYTSIGRVQKFAKMTGLFDTSTNYTIDETKQYIAGMEYLLTNTALGTHYPNPEFEKKHFAPFVRAMEYIRIFGEKSMKPEDLNDFRKETERCKLPDPTGRNSLGLVDVDEFLDRLIERYRKVVEDSKEYLQVVFKAGDINERGCVFVSEFMAMYKMMEGDRGDEKRMGEIFNNSCDVVTKEEIGLSFNKMVALCVEHNIFSESRQNFVLGIVQDTDITKRFTDLKTKWEQHEKDNLNEMASRVQPVVSKEISKDWADSIEWLEKKLLESSEDLAVQKAVILKHRVLVGDITLVSSKIYTH